MRTYGLIGEKLKHSFSKDYFENKFKSEGIGDCRYELFELSDIAEIPKLFKSIPSLKGFNITIPYKEDVLPLLNECDETVVKVGAVNIVKVNEDASLKGFNTDFPAFRESLIGWGEIPRKALVLGTGGASKAVVAALDELGITYQLVSRQSRGTILSYVDIKNSPEIVENHKLIINTTPLGMYPDVVTFPNIPYERLTANHYLYDLVYNPKTTRFLELGKQQGTKTKNGLEMLQLQAELSWEIWNMD